MEDNQAQCPHCGALNPEEAFFCGECGGQARSLMTGDGGTLEPSAEAPTGGQPTYEAPRPEPAPPPPLDVHAPGAGLTPPPPGPPPPPQQGTEPPPGAPQAPPQVQPYTPPPNQPYTPGQPYAPPQQQYQQGGYPPGQAPGYGAPPDGNTSGMGPNYLIPPEASGWTFAGCIPIGLFGFLNGSTLWGVIGLLGGLLGGIPGIIYLIYIGIQGRELAWRSRRFNSVQEYVETMTAWNKWGLIVGIVGGVLGALLFIGYFAMVFYFVAAEGMGP